MGSGALSCEESGSHKTLLEGQVAARGLTRSLGGAGEATAGCRGERSAVTEIARRYTVAIRKKAPSRALDLVVNIW